VKHEPKKLFSSRGRVPYLPIILESRPVILRPSSEADLPTFPLVCRHLNERKENLSRTAYSVDNETGAEPFSIARFTRSMHWIVRTAPTTLVHIFNHATGNGSHVHVVGVLKPSSDRPSQLEEAGRFITNMAIGTRSLKPAARWHAIFFPASGTCVTTTAQRPCSHRCGFEFLALWRCERPVNIIENAKRRVQLRI
jgi:hypothetical protein